jgi:hypothetical protein
MCILQYNYELKALVHNWYQNENEKTGCGPGAGRQRGVFLNDERPDRSYDRAVEARPKRYAVRAIKNYLN